MTTREKIKNGIIQNIQDAVKSGIENEEINIKIEECPPVQLEVPREKEHGDFATNIAMKLPGIAHQPPRQIAESIISHFNKEDLPVAEIEIAGPGFINFKLEPDWLSPVVTEILESGPDYGKRESNGKRINVEYVSANPTGPMHIGNARGAAIGDVLASIYEAGGYDVTREFYVNDAGNQIEKFGTSLNLRYKELLREDVEFPEDLYQGRDIIENAKAYFDSLSPDEREEFSKLDENERKKRLTAFALDRNLSDIKSDLADYGVNFDVWFSEKFLHDNGKVEEALEKLKQSGKTYEKDDAIWFRSTDYGLDKDDVLIRGNGIPTYFLADIAYHMNKFAEREFVQGIDIWGADHYGHIKRLQSALEALGQGDKLTVVTMQLVRLKYNDELMRVSKRKGNAVSLSDLTGQIGKDAARFFFNLRSPDSQFELDLKLAVEESNENPVFYVQYAHARIASILRKIEENYKESDVDITLLDSPEEIELLNILSLYPEELDISREMMDPSRITHYAMDLASAFHSFYNACRVNVEDPKIRSSRIALIKAVKQVLSNIAALLGIEAPEKM